MFDLVKNILTKKNDSNAQANVKSDQDRTRIAAAVLLLEAAHIDDECTEDELNHVLHTLQTNFKLSEAITKELVDIAHAEKSEAVDLWEFTNHINETHSIEEKIILLEAVWRIIYMDGRLDKHEDHFAHRLAKLLRLSHREMIGAKLAAKEKMNADTTG